MDEFFADTVTSSSSGAAAPVGDGMAATSASGQQAQDPDDEGFLSEFELILPKFVAILKSIQDGGEDRDITNDLNAHFKKCNQTLDELPGTDLTHAQQQALLHQYQDQLKRKSALIAKYQSLPVLRQSYTDDADDDNGMRE